MTREACLKERKDVEGSVVTSSDGQALEGCSGRISQQGQQLPPCPSLLQNCCKEVWCPAAHSHAPVNGEFPSMQLQHAQHVLLETHSLTLGLASPWLTLRVMASESADA